MILICLAFALALHSVSGEVAAEELPSWITNSPGFKEPTQVDSKATGKGDLETSGIVSKGWQVSLNEKAGHGVELQVEKLSLNPDSSDFLMISAWPLGKNFKKVKLLTGKFEKPLNRIRIPNTKTMFVLYSATDQKHSPGMRLSYRRYGTALELDQPSTENPAKKKETVFEVQLKGKGPEDLAAPDFLPQVKEAVRAAAARYCSAHNVSFNQQIPTEEMVLIHKITFCPFEWPERDVCASVKHSVFVSGLRIPDEAIILDYQLTADHLQAMWNEDAFPELQALGITVFQLPATEATLGYWILIIGLVIISSLIATFIIWKANKPEDTSPGGNSAESGEQKKAKRPKLKLSKHQRVPSFMYKTATDSQVDKLRDSAFMTATEESIDDILKPGVPNYLASIVFGANRAFEDDEDKVEVRQKSPLVQ